MKKEAIKRVFSFKRTKIIIGIMIFSSLWMVFDISYYASKYLGSYSPHLQTYSTYEKIDTVSGMIIYFLIYYFISYRYEIKKLKKIKEYQDSEYFKETGNSYEEVITNVGAYGEKLTVDILSKVEGYKKILVNLYVPKQDGTTSELDAIMIHETGVYVFESKNYSGWIYGRENQKLWLQVLNYGKIKNQFYNPIWQNEGHVKNLQSFLDDIDIPFFSYIIFSERCKLENIEFDSRNCVVINRDKLWLLLHNMIGQNKIVLTVEEIDDLYLKLKALTQITSEVKLKHIEEVRSKVN